jgi:hypothetical protein
MFGLNGIGTLEAADSAMGKKHHAPQCENHQQRGRDGQPNDLGRHVQAIDPGSGIMADPEGPADVGERDGCHLAVEFGHYGSDQDAAETEEGLDIHGGSSSLLDEPRSLAGAPSSNLTLDPKGCPFRQRWSV